MKRTAWLLLVGVCLFAVVWVGGKETAKRKSKFLDAKHSVSLLSHDLIATMGDKPTLETVVRAQILLNQRSPSIREQIKELRDAGRLRKNSDERIEFDEFISKKTDELIDYYEKYSNLVKDDFDALDSLKNRYISNNSESLRMEITRKNDSLKTNADVIRAMDDLMAGLEEIYKEVEMEDENV